MTIFQHSSIATVAIQSVALSLHSKEFDHAFDHLGISKPQQSHAGFAAISSMAQGKAMLPLLLLGLQKREAVETVYVTTNMIVCRVLNCPSTL